jgi:hypothetical protein
VYIKKNIYVPSNTVVQCVFYLHIHTLVLEKYSGDFFDFFFLVLISNHGANNICILLLTASVAVNRGFEPRSGQIKAIKLICVASSLSTQH